MFGFIFLQVRVVSHTTFQEKVVHLKGCTPLHPMLPLALVDMMTPSKTIDHAKVGRKAWQAFNNKRKPRKSLTRNFSRRLAWEGWKSYKMDENGGFEITCCCCCCSSVFLCCCCSRCLRLIARSLGKKTRIQSIMRIKGHHLSMPTPPNEIRSYWGNL